MFFFVPGVNSPLLGVNPSYVHSPDGLDSKLQTDVETMLMTCSPIYIYRWE
jgi:hypothetical protein